MDAGWIWFIPCLHDLTMKIWKELEAHGSWEVMPERDRSSSLLRATPTFSCLHCRSNLAEAHASQPPAALHRGADKLRRLRNILSAFISPPWASKALPAGSEDVTDNTSSSSSLLSSAADEREMKNSSLKLISKLPLRSPQTQSPHCLSSGWTRAAGGRWSPQFSREKGQTRAELSQRKRLTMNALHSLNNRASVLFTQCISRVCHLVSETLTRIGTPPKAFHNTHTSETKSPEDKKRMTCSTGALLWRSFAYVIGLHLPMSSALCVCIHASEPGHAEGVPIAPSKGRSVEVPFRREIEFTYL